MTSADSISPGEIRFVHDKNVCSYRYEDLAKVCLGTKKANELFDVSGYCVNHRGNYELVKDEEGIHYIMFTLSVLNEPNMMYSDEEYNFKDDADIFHVYVVAIKDMPVPTFVSYK
jgi:hypothetical protein